MNFDKKYINTIIKANNDNSLAIFIGAGISKSSDTDSVKLPSWNDLIEDLKKELGVYKESDYLKIAQLYYLAFGEFNYYKKIKEYFPEHIQPSSVHKLIFELKPHILITTNWDNLLEKSIEENAYIYDIVCNDNDLVKSSLQNKLIKMHGDFTHNNIVFKEDDYINYIYNFPLIENFVRSILSTHTVLFLGYSYNDINLKQILKWIQNHSAVRPPMYISTFEDNSIQKKYLENHGITSVYLDKMSKNDSYSNRLIDFLTKIKNPARYLDPKYDNEVILYIYDKLKNLGNLNGILLEQIQYALSNCGFIFENDYKPIIEFYDQLLTGDIDKNIRSIHIRFLNIISNTNIDENKNPNIIKIFEILDKARIKGIATTPDSRIKKDARYLVIKNYLKDTKLDSIGKYISFDYREINKSSSNIESLLENSYKSYSIQKLEEADELLEKAISICLKQRNYVTMFILMFNRNILLQSIKSDLTIINNKYTNIEEYNLKEKYNNLPKDIQQSLEPIYDFINFTFIYKLAYNISEELKKTEESKRTIDSGGWVLNSDIYKYSSKHEDLVNFVLKNKIMIEDFLEYKNINKYFIKIALTRQVQKEAISLNRIELFSCVKYFENDELKLLLDDYYNTKSDQKGKFQISNENLMWLVDNVLKNVIDNYLSVSKTFNKFEGYIENTLFILSLSKLSLDFMKSIMELVKKIIHEGSNTIGIFKSINLFLGIQFNIYKQEIEDNILIEIIETIINKLVYNKFNGFEYMALTRNELSNLYGYANNNKVLLDNTVLIKKLLSEVESYPISSKMEIFQTFVLKLYYISTETIKKIIVKSLSNIKIEDEKEIFKRIIFNLTLIIYELKTLEKQFLTELDKYLTKYKDSESFSTILFTIDSQIDYLIENRGLTELKKFSKILKVSIKRYKDNKELSIF